MSTDSPPSPARPGATGPSGDSRVEGSVASGAVLLAAAKFVFLVAAWGTIVVLSRLVDPATAGSYGAIARVIAVPNMVIIQTLVFAVSRPMAAQRDAGFPAYAALRKRGVTIAAVMGGVIASVVGLGAPAIAAWLGDPELALPLRVLAPISLFYAIYAVNVGTLNATRRFPQQAGLDMFMACSKSGLIILAAFLGFDLAYIVGGFTTASALTLVASVFVVWWVRPRLATPTHHVPPMAGYAGALVVFTLATHLLLNVDLLILKHFALDDMEKANAGRYWSALNVSMVPYSLLTALNLTMFPLIAALDREGDAQKIALYVGTTVRVALTLLVFMAAIASFGAEQVMHLLYNDAYQAGADYLRWTVWAYSGYAFCITVAWICNSRGLPRVALVMLGLLVSVTIALEWFWISAQGAMGATWAVSVSGALAVVGAWIVAVRVFAVRVPWATLVELAACTVPVALLCEYWKPTSKLAIVVELGLCALLFVVVAFLTKAVTREELEGLRRGE